MRYIKKAMNKELLEVEAVQVLRNNMPLLTTFLSIGKEEEGKPFFASIDRQGILLDNLDQGRLIVAIPAPYGLYAAIEESYIVKESNGNISIYTSEDFLNAFETYQEEEV